MQPYGAQSIEAPLGAVRLCPSGAQEAAAAAKHFAVAASQRKFVAQSASSLHDVPHAVPAHTNGVHCIVSAGQVPLPSQFAAEVAVPSAHEAARHAVSAPASPTQATVVTPSHAAALHTFAPTAARQEGRPFRGAPLTGVHLPGAPGRLHASHWPVQTASQQTPSTQWLAAHSASLVHVWASPAAHCPEALHPFWGLVHVSGSGPLMTAEQTPGFGARLHAWHVPHAALSQHVPSTQLPVSQSVPTEQVPPRV
jgi:hypothetical protein